MKYAVKVVKNEIHNVEPGGIGVQVIHISHTDKSTIGEPLNGEQDVLLSRSVGDYFEYDGELYKVMDGQGLSCEMCFFSNKKCPPIEVCGHCEPESRTDGKYIYFKHIKINEE